MSGVLICMNVYPTGSVQYLASRSICVLHGVHFSMQSTQGWVSAKEMLEMHCASTVYELFIFRFAFLCLVCVAH